ncbi:MAG: tetratricopeptide repeat protein [Bacteroidia bacterium]|nr:tetratricopeptide repeat protein [Bacteroidia bacterium]
MHLLLRLAFLFFSLIVQCAFSQTIKNPAFEQYKAEIKLVKKFSYSDSAQMYVHGKKAMEIIKKNKIDYLEAEIKLCYANYFFFQTDYKKAKKFYEEGEAIATKYQNDTLGNIIKVKYAFIEHELGNWSNSKKIYEEVIKNSERVNDTTALIEALNGFANLKEIQNKSDEALELYNRALTIADKSEQKFQFAYLLNNRALLNMKLNSNSLAKKDLLKALSLSRQDRLTGNILNNIGLIYMNEQKPDTITIKKTDPIKKQKADSISKHKIDSINTQKIDSAFLYFDKFYTLAKKSGVPEGLVVGLLNISQIKALKGNIDEAILWCDSALKIAEEHQMIFHTAKILNGLSQHYIKKKDLKAAITFANRSLAASKKTNSFEDIAGSWNLLSQSYSELKDYKNAFECHEKFKLFSDSLFNLSSKKRFDELQVQYEVEQKEKTIEEDKNKLAIVQKESEIESTRKKIWLILLGSVAIIVCGGLYLRYVRSTKKQQEIFSQKLIESIEEERSRIAKELHDDIGTNLSIVKNKIVINTEKGDKQLFRDLTADIGSVIDQTRSISHQLYPSYLYKLSINEAITHFLNRVEKDADLNIVVHLDDNLEPHLSPARKMHLFRIIQELINNTIKHAEASNVKLEITNENNEKIIMIYEDNGKGIQSGPNDGMGMISMRERVKIMNGKMKIGGEGEKDEKGFKISFIFSVED